MKKVALQIEHKFKNRVVGTHLLDGVGDTVTMGASRTARIRLVGDDIAGMHAAFECVDGKWTLMDLGSESGTWVNQKAVVECEIDGPTVIHIGAHQLKATPHAFERPLFTKDASQGEGDRVFHQAVLLHKGLVQRTAVLDPVAPFDAGLGPVGSLPAPTSEEWQTTEFGDWTVRQRLTRSRIVEESLKEKIGDDWRGPAPVFAAMFFITVIGALMFLMPQKPDDELKTLTPAMKNQYTRLIFDGQKVRKQKEVAEKMRKRLQGQSRSGVAKKSPGGDTGSKVAGGNKKAPGAKVVMNLKNAGLGALIGKVAARAAKNAHLVESAGVNAASATSGRALGLGGGSSLDKLGGGGGGTGNTMKVGGLGTAGKGGGSSGYKGSGALSLGNIGNAEVGVLDEETVVDGGLDRDVIARVIRSQLGQIRYCYERQLSANPDLYGKIMVKFTIGAAGSVVAQAIGTTSLNNAMVEGCILRRIAGWKFPQPTGGTNVLVTYPFLFKSTK